MVLRTLTNVPLGLKYLFCHRLSKPGPLGSFGEHNIVTSIDGNALQTYEFIVFLSYQPIQLKLILSVANLMVIINLSAEMAWQYLIMTLEGEGGGGSGGGECELYIQIMFSSKLKTHILFFNFN